MTDRAGWPASSPAGHPVLAPADEYVQWRERVLSTYRAVHFTCGHRLSDPSLAGPVAVGVVTGLLARPTVFRYFGLPFSGRIATLAEDLLARAEAGEVIVTDEWSRVEDRLDRIPVEHRDVLVAVCVRGEDVATLAHTLGCDGSVAADRRAATLDYMREVVAAGRDDPGPVPGQEG